MSELTEETMRCTCGSYKFYVIEGTDTMTGDYVLLRCTECKKDYGVSCGNYGDIVTDIPSVKEDDE